MKTVKRLFGLVIVLILFALGAASVWWILARSEPSYNGKSLSVWLDELSTVDHSRLRDQSLPAVVAVTAIGTNALPWLIGEFTKEPSAWQWKVNGLLATQSVIKFRFPSADDRLTRATRGFRVLGPVAAPAIPALMIVVEKRPGYVPGALAGIGPSAFPPLQQCLTNCTTFPTTRGPFIPIPGNAISGLQNEIYAGRLSKYEVSVFLPEIRVLAQSTNVNAAIYANNFLKEMEK